MDLRLEPIKVYELVKDYNKSVAFYKNKSIAEQDANECNGGYTNEYNVIERSMFTDGIEIYDVYPKGVLVDSTEEYKQKVIDKIKKKLSESERKLLNL